MESSKVVKLPSYKPFSANATKNNTFNDCVVDAIESAKKDCGAHRDVGLRNMFT